MKCRKSLIGKFFLIIILFGISINLVLALTYDNFNDGNNVDKKKFIEDQLHEVSGFESVISVSGDFSSVVYDKNSGKLKLGDTSLDLKNFPAAIGGHNLNSIIFHAETATTSGGIMYTFDNENSVFLSQGRIDSEGKIHDVPMLEGKEVKAKFDANAKGQVINVLNTGTIQIQDYGKYYGKVDIDGKYYGKAEVDIDGKTFGLMSHNNKIAEIDIVADENGVDAFKFNGRMKADDFIMENKETNTISFNQDFSAEGLVVSKLEDPNKVGGTMTDISGMVNGQILIRQQGDVELSVAQLDLAEGSEIYFYNPEGTALSYASYASSGSSPSIYTSRDSGSYFNLCSNCRFIRGGGLVEGQPVANIARIAAGTVGRVGQVVVSAQPLRTAGRLGLGAVRVGAGAARGVVSGVARVGGGALRVGGTAVRGVAIVAGRGAARVGAGAARVGGGALRVGGRVAGGAGRVASAPFRFFRR